ncbi:RNA recognition motif (aka RRM, RBD, or RNP domain) [Mariprofundus ferrinatatus]|uniref:RNA recognition motif (Aka RRM, RBD, or RNP domain) n=1 Tax=Mariprofundus ferrinatatus TaxID=1921087 RepID=A0A2K8L6X5_9PROT|nr:RNA-binding protein [Mariprofundus ferrinatatus]ATX82983.1 RNA recognition motif (aka RRM, RBD, or RNP domain) [Mariprofundus ferrinatatus]
MSVSCFAKLFAAAIAVSVVGSYAIQLVGLDSIHPSSLFASGLTLGTIFGGLLVALYPSEKGEGSKRDSGTSNIYVGNLPFNVGKEEIGNIFAPFGKVEDIRLVKDRRSRRFKGYAFVEMESGAAKAAIDHLNDTDYAGRTLRVNEAQKRDSRS